MEGPIRFGLTSIDPSIGVTAGVTYTFAAFFLASLTNWH
jgi:hypothetical protein